MPFYFLTYIILQKPQSAFVCVKTCQINWEMKCIKSEKYCLLIMLIDNVNIEMHDRFMYSPIVSRFG